MSSGEICSSNLGKNGHQRGIHVLPQDSSDEYPDFNFYALNGMRLTCPDQVSLFISPQRFPVCYLALAGLCGDVEITDWGQGHP